MAALAALGPMARLNFTPNLVRHLGVASMEVRGETLGQALEQAFVELGRGRGYVLDDQGHVRHHVAVFIDGTLIKDRASLSDPLGERSEIWLMQALSGG